MEAGEKNAKDRNDRETAYTSYFRSVFPNMSKSQTQILGSTNRIEATRQDISELNREQKQRWS